VPGDKFIGNLPAFSYVLVQQLERHFMHEFASLLREALSIIAYDLAQIGSIYAKVTLRARAMSLP
jgi:hypothetical protein